MALLLAADFAAVQRSTESPCLIVAGTKGDLLYLAQEFKRLAAIQNLSPTGDDTYLIHRQSVLPLYANRMESARDDNIEDYVSKIVGNDRYFKCNSRRFFELLVSNSKEDDRFGELLFDGARCAEASGSRFYACLSFHDWLLAISLADEEILDSCELTGVLVATSDSYELMAMRLLVLSETDPGTSVEFSSTIEELKHLSFSLKFVKCESEMIEECREGVEASIRWLALIATVFARKSIEQTKNGRA